MLLENFNRDVHHLIGIRLTPAQIAALETYAHELLQWNRRFNLTAIRDPEGVRVRHFLDSLTCWIAMRHQPPQRVVDVGTGAGFPGLPLKIVFPSIQLTLIESVGKKVRFCRHMVEKLQLQDVQVIHARAEEVGRMPAHREQYDWAIARAVAQMPILAEYLLPLVRVGGRMLAQKGESGPAEAQAAEHAFRLLGGRLHRLFPIQLPGVAEDRYLVVVDKVVTTPERYPRRVGIPAKRPL